LNSHHDLSGIQHDCREDILTNSPTALHVRLGKAWQPLRGG